MRLIKALIHCVNSLGTSMSTISEETVQRALSRRHGGAADCFVPETNGAVSARRFVPGAAPSFLTDAPPASAVAQLP
jgi:hypothetical protein